MVGEYPEVFHASGTGNWIECDRIYQVPAGAAFLALEPANFGLSGKIEFADLRLEAVRDPAKLNRDVPPPDGMIEKELFSLADAWRNITSTRERICLNGLWQFHPVLPNENSLQLPPTGSGWGYFKVPGAWPVHPNGMQFYLSPLLFGEIRLDELGCAWYRREIEVPVGWDGRQILLNAELTAKRLKVAETRLQKLDQDAVELYRARSKAEAAATRLERELAELRRFQANAAGERSALQNRLDQANLQLKEQQAQIGSQENDLQNLRRQLQDTLKNGGDSVTLNAQLLDENRKLRESLTELQGAAATSQEQNTQLQNKQRDLQLELVQVRDLLQRLEATRTRLEAEKGELLKTLEREKGGAELASVELKNQRERIARLESDIQTWSDRCNRLEKRLAERKQEDYDAIAASDAAKQ